MRRATEFPDSDTVGFPDDQSPTQSRPVDPALVAARLLIEHALDAVGTTTEDAGRDGAVCTVVVPSVAWTEIARDAWKYYARDGGSYSDNVSRFWTQDRWLACAPTAPRTANHRFAGIKDSEEETFADAIWRGLHCAGFAAEISWLPPDLVQAADYRLRLPTLTGADLCALASEICGAEPTVFAEMQTVPRETFGFPLSDDEAASLTPRLLRLARRQGQTADDYLRKLGDLLKREGATAAPAHQPIVDTPRDAPTLDRLHGLEEAVAWGRALAHDLDAYRAGALPWSAVDRGCLLSGPPGTGKTLFARALAATCGVPLVTGSYGEWLGSGGAHQGDLLKSMWRAFADARSKAPAILFLDEVDSFPDRARVTHRYREWDTQVVNALLAEIDGVQTREGVVVIGACNHADRLDPALTRSGRLDRHIQIHLPDRPALARILREHLGDDLAGEDLAGAALLAAGSSGADCERYVRGARRRARAAGRLVTINDLVAEVSGDDDADPLEVGLAAVHEAGHAVAAAVLCPGSLGVVSLTTSDRLHGGRSSVQPLPNYPVAAEIRTRLAIQLAGRAAEEVVLGEPSAGAGGSELSDLAQATRLATAVVTSLGLDSEAGLLWTGFPEDDLPRMLLNPALARRVREMLGDAYARALEVIREHRAAVEGVAGALVTRRVLDGAEVARIVGLHS